MPVLPREFASVVVRKKTGLVVLIDGWWVVGIAICTILPWAVVPVFDAIDSSYRRLSTVCFRLFLSTACNVVAYVFSIIFVVLLVEDSSGKLRYDRFDEIATFFVLLLFNVWFVMRNLRGWIQVFSLRCLRRQFESLQGNFSKALYRSPHVDTRSSAACIEGIANILISNRLIDNDLQTRTAFLNPFAPQGRSWDLAMWRAFWTQSTRRAVSLTVNGDYNVNPNRTLAQDLPEKGPQWPKELESENGNAHIRTCTPDVYNSATRLVIPRNDRDAWERALSIYGDSGRETPQGQQDTRGRGTDIILRPNDGSGLATIVFEKTRCTPHRMTALWYATARFEDMYEGLVREIKAANKTLLLPDVFPLWREIAQDITSNLPEKLFLSDDALTCYAGELASSSILLQYYPDRFSELVRLIFEDGRCARWTFGWSGLLSCFSNLWTYDRVFIALLSGLSLLALRSATRVKKIEPCVRAMLVGYASFAVSERAVGKQIAKLRKAELLHRYKEVRGVTCRGSGVSVTRLACQVLNLPAEASCMDGLPAFSTGWAFEYMECKPGNQTPEHGGTHDEIEAKEGSTTACRYPNTHF